VEYLREDSKAFSKRKSRKTKAELARLGGEIAKQFNKLTEIRNGQFDDPYLFSDDTT